VYYEYLTLEQKITYLELRLELLRFDYSFETQRQRYLLTSEIERLEGILQQQRWNQGFSEVTEWASKQNQQAAICNVLPQDKRQQAEFAFDVAGIVESFTSPPQTLAGQLLAAGSIVHTVRKYLH